MKLQSFTLHISNPEQSVAFYKDILGFTLLKVYGDNDSTVYELGFDGSELSLLLKHTPSSNLPAYHEHPQDNYWKFSLFVNDIQKIYAHLKQLSHPASEPSQFDDIGYLSHTLDNENHKVEFIQRTFKQTGVLDSQPSSPVQQSPALGLITIRSKDPVKTIGWYEQILDLKLLVRMTVNRGRGFMLYFLGHKDLQPPSHDIDAVENREWLYQQTEMFIEIQHYCHSEFDDDFNLNTDTDTGLESINFKGDTKRLANKLNHLNVAFTFADNKDNSKSKGVIKLNSVDGHQILVS